MALRDSLANIAISRVEEFMKRIEPLKYTVSLLGPKCFSMLDDKTDVFEEMIFSRFSINFRITEQLSGWQSGLFAIVQGAWKRHTSQNNQPHLPYARPQTFSERHGW